MILNVKTMLRNNLPLKIMSLLIAYGLWITLNSNYSLQTDVTVPLCFYDVPENWNIQAPEEVTITLQGKRSLLQRLRKEQLSIHINSAELGLGKQPLKFSEKSLFLPKSIKLVHYTPLPVIITIEEKVKADA